MTETNNEMDIDEESSKIKHIVLVLSGKGGVGKSTVSVNLALSLYFQGFKVGILDVDLTGPSIPRMFQVDHKQVHQASNGYRNIDFENDVTFLFLNDRWVPVFVDQEQRLSVMSIAFLLQNKDDAIVWRGPKKNAMIKQFLSDVSWGELDYLIIDTPPGTSDEHISLVEFLRGQNLDGAVVVTTPQAVSLADVRKELNFCKKVEVPVLGVIENMSGFVCPHCAECSDIFSKGGGEKMANDFKVPFLGSIPIDPSFSSIVKDDATIINNFRNSSLFNSFYNISLKLTLNTLEEKSEQQSENNIGNKSDNFDIFSKEATLRDLDYKLLSDHSIKNYTGQISLNLLKSVRDLKFFIELHVFCWKRNESLKRLLKSLNNANYFHKFSVPVSIVFHLDGGYTKKVLATVENFEWVYGKKTILKSEIRKGLQDSIVDAWSPKSSNEFAIFLEDDIEVSSLFYKYAIFCISRFLIKDSAVTDINGCSLYTPRINEITPSDPQKPENFTIDELKLKTTIIHNKNKEVNIYKFQLPCSWGAIYEPTHWIKFKVYYNKRKLLYLDKLKNDKDIDLNNESENVIRREFPLVPNSRSNYWSQSWKKFMIEYMVAKNIKMIYPNFNNQTSFSTNHYEEGIHTVKEGDEEIVTDSLRQERDIGLVDFRFTVPLFQVSENHLIWSKLLKYFNNSNKLNVTRNVNELALVTLYHEFGSETKMAEASKTYFNKIYDFDKEVGELLL
ncbi:cytosolic Fe-S cluster assembly factor cfd1 [Lobulomyces angularis]|nr:cytosolic Fe-S cluster assembly factor cfd1 [Lobulomyces angularis]